MKYQEIYNESMKNYALRTPNSQKAYEKAKNYMTGGETRSIVYFKPHPLTVERASGPYLYDIDDNCYIDFLNNYTSMIHGHAHPDIVEKITPVLSKGTCYGSAIPEQIDLAHMLCDRIPSLEKVRFCNSGTEAILFAVRAARAFTGKDAIIKMEGGFHGSIDLVQHSIAPPIPYPENHKSWEPIPDCKGISKNVSKDIFIAPFNDAKAVENILEENSDKIAAIVLEPVMGQTGAISAKTDYLKDLRQLADKYNVLLIFDEIQSLRVAYGGAQSKYKVTPDLTTVGKFIGGGFPIAAFGGRSDVMSMYDPQKEEFIAHSGTFNGNRIGMVAGVVSLELLCEKAIQKLNDYAKDLQDGLTSIADKLKLPVSVARNGSLMHVHYTKEVPYDYTSTKSPHNAMNKIVHMELLNRGIFIAPRGSMNLSTVMTEDDIKKTISAFEEVFDRIKTLF